MTSHDAVPDRLIIAIGGNAIHPEGIRGTAEEQEKLAAEIGMTERTLRRLSVAEFGYGPKTLARILRLQDLLARIGGGNSLAGLAAEAGFADFTETSMVWTAKDDRSDVQVFVRCDGIPDEVTGGKTEE